MELDHPIVPRTPREGALIRGAEALRRDGATIYAEELDAMLAELVAELDREHELAVLREPSGEGRDRPLPLAAIDQEGRRTDAPPPAAPGVYTVEQARELREIRLQAERVDVERYALQPDGSTRFSRALEILTLASSPIPGRDGWRRTGDGREWYSDAWLGQAS